jgi:hypothetical protein
MAERAQAVGRIVVAPTTVRLEATVCAARDGSGTPWRCPRTSSPTAGAPSGWTCSPTSGGGGRSPAQARYVRRVVGRGFGTTF